ncbi:alpha/beta hydrolase [Salibacterium aidingense]|uniref:alpha/beta hydrolase n=1 Tax=Salibacterium aidingense TaxID=384933 RepID=UPI00041716C1|nr:alpha/beta hydrolase [Salibacterium aidingense]
MYIDGHFSGTDGVNLFYRGWVPQKPRALLILVHGAGEHSGRYSNIGEACMDHEIALVAPDLRGFGQSKGPRGHVNNFKDYLDDLDTIIELFHAQYEPVPLFLFGHSFGGLIVIRYGQIYPHKAEGFILSSPALGIRFHIPFLFKKMLDFISWMSPGLSIQPLKWTGMLRKVRQLKPYFPENPALVQDPFFTFEYTPRWLAELLHNGTHALSEASKFRFPTLCLYDQLDPIIHPGSVQRFLNSIIVQDKKHVMFTEGLHRPWHAHHKHQAMENVITWLNTRL